MHNKILDISTTNICNTNNLFYKHVHRGFFETHNTCQEEINFYLNKANVNVKNAHWKFNHKIKDHGQGVTLHI